MQYGPGLPPVACSSHTLRVETGEATQWDALRKGAKNMVDRGRARDVNEAAARFAETLAESYRLVYGQAAESAERQQQRAREFSELVSSNLSEQAEAGRADAPRP